jgi:hypothetical protein
MQSSPLPCYLVLLSSKYPPQHRILQNSLHFFLNVSEQVSRSSFFFLSFLFQPVFT